MHLLPGRSIAVRARVRSHRISLANLVAWAFFIGLPAGFGAALLLHLLQQDFIRAAVSAPFFALFAWAVAKELREPQPVRIIPYFDARLPEARTFLSGLALARYSAALDALAMARAVRPLSSFGFADDADGDEIVWHDAGDGVKAFEFLAGRLRGCGSTAPAAAELREDVARVRDALMLADQRRIRFCLLVWIGRWVCPIEMEKRQGHV